MKPVLALIVLILHLYEVESVEIIWDNSVDFDFNSFDVAARQEEVRMPNRFFIFPGTKWCGAGNISEHDNDYGIHRDTDKCCKNHDKCPDIIEGFQTKHNLTNPSFYTRLSCDCDQEFYRCLKTVNTIDSNQVGHLYFTLLGTKCFENEHPIEGCDHYTYFPWKKCIKPNLNTAEDKLYQWFDVPNF